MAVQKLIIRSVALAAIAGGGVAAAQHFGFGVAPGRAQPVVQADAGPQAIPAPPVLADGAVLPPPPLPVPVPEPPPPAATVAQAPQTAEPPQATSPLGLPCGLSVSGEAMPGAVVAVDIMEPCAPNARVTITHGPLVFDARTDGVGLLTLDIPALETPAFITVRFEDGTEATTLAGLPDLIDFDRVAITWDEDRELQLHAFAAGAEFGGPGHVWQETPGSLADAITGTGGVLTQLGDASLDAPRLAQVYTVPRALRDDLAVSVEVPVTERNCGQPVRAQSIAIAPDGAITARPISFVLPGCDTVGEYLLLQNLFQDLRLASN